MNVSELLTLAVVSQFTLACAVAHAQSPAKGQGQTWPTKPIRMLVGFPAGGPTDVVARLVSEKLSAQINQRIIVDNRTGASGNIAVEILAKSIPDGHTLLYSSNLRPRHRKNQRGARESDQERRPAAADRAAGHGSNRDVGEGIQRSVSLRARALDEGGARRRPQG